jgi:prevent-host-death family protein
MQTVINAKTLREQLAQIMERVRKGERFTVIYRSKPVCQIVPIDAPGGELGDLRDDPLFQAGAVGTSQDGKSSRDHDEALYGRRDDR